MNQPLVLVAAFLLASSVWGGALSFGTKALPRAIAGQPYRAKITTMVDGRCTSSEVSFLLASGRLPPGLDLAADGVAGTPTEMGVHRFTLVASNGCTRREQEFKLTVTGQPLLQVQPEAVSFEYRVGEPPPPARSLLVSSTWFDLPYQATGSADWVACRVTRGFTPGQGAAFSGDMVFVEISPEKLPPGTHTAAVTISAWQALNQAVIPVRVTVLPAEGLTVPQK